jgi:hypothetical protein
LSAGPRFLPSLAQRSISRKFAVVAQAASAGNLPALNGSFRRTLRAEDKSERTVKSYTEAVGLFADFLAQRRHLVTVDAITRDDVRAFVGRARPSGAKKRVVASPPGPAHGRGAMATGRYARNSSPAR